VLENGRLVHRGKPSKQKGLVFVRLDPVKPRPGSMRLATAQTPEEFCIRVIDVEQKLYEKGSDQPQEP